MDKETKEEFENLARMVQDGFLELKGEIGSVRTELKEEISSVRTELKEDIAMLDMKVSRIDRRTENQADSLYEDIHELKDRVAVVEKKNGIIPQKSKFATA